MRDITTDLIIITCKIYRRLSKMRNNINTMYSTIWHKILN